MSFLLKMYCKIDKNVLQWKNLEKNRERKFCKTWTDFISMNIPTFFHHAERMCRNRLLCTLHWCKDYKANDWPLMKLKQLILYFHCQYLYFLEKRQFILYFVLINSYSNSYSFLYQCATLEHSMLFCPLRDVRKTVCDSTSSSSWCTY